MGLRRSSAIAAAAMLVMTACAGDAADQPDAGDTTTPPAAQPTTPEPAAPATNVELPEGVTQEMVAQGSQVFNQQICFTCHGTNGAGGPLGPVLTDDTWINTDGTLEGITEIVRNGVPTPKEYPAAMPAMGGVQLSEDQIHAVAAYVYTLSHGG